MCEAFFVLWKCAGGWCFGAPGGWPTATDMHTDMHTDIGRDLKILRQSFWSPRSRTFRFRFRFSWTNEISKRNWWPIKKKNVTEMYDYVGASSHEPMHTKLNPNKWRCARAQTPLGATQKAQIHAWACSHLYESCFASHFALSGGRVTTGIGNALDRLASSCP